MKKFCHGTNGGWRKYPNNPVLGGDLGVCFDVTLLRDNDRYLMYFSWRSKCSVALATSDDGIHWSEPRICVAPRPTPQGWEDKIGRPSVVKVGSIYHMWYTGQYKGGQPDGTSDIFHAVSEDGVTFVRTSDKPVLSATEVWEKQAVMCPSVLWDEKTHMFRMWYSGGEQYEPNAIGYAESQDGLVWHKSALNPIFVADPSSSWECHKVTACQVFQHEGWYWMFYIGFRNEDYAHIGVARSRNGLTDWQRSKLNPLIAPDENAWDGEACYKPFVLFDGEKWLLWYNGRRGTVEQIGLAIHDNPTLSF